MKARQLRDQGFGHNVTSPSILADQAGVPVKQLRRLFGGHDHALSPAQIDEVMKSIGGPENFDVAKDFLLS